MYEARVAGGNYTIAACGHPVRPGEGYLHDGETRQAYCPDCGIALLSLALLWELEYLQRLAGPAE